MPPWKPDPGYGDFEGERRLTDDQIAVIRQWVADGVLEGTPADLPKPPAFTPGWQLGRPDLIVTMPKAFEMPANGPDVFRNFVLPVSIKSRRFVRAIEFRPGTTKAIHHARVLIDETRESRWRDGQDAEPGFGREKIDQARVQIVDFTGQSVYPSAGAGTRFVQDDHVRW